MDIYQESLKLHEKWNGKLEISSKAPLNTEKDISLAYTPGVAEPCREINKDKNNAYLYTNKWNTVAIVTDGTAVLGLGDIGPEAGLPVMEGKAALFKKFGGVDAFPICLATKDTDEIVNTVINIAPSFGGINLEDISAPRCFEIERRLIQELDIPVFHDDQHGTAIVILAGLVNALKIVGKKLENISIVMNGAGAAGIATTRLLLNAGVKDIILCDTKGAIYEGREGMNVEKVMISKLTNKSMKKGCLSDVIKGTDVFIGVSVPGVLDIDMVKTMNNDSIIFAMANPTPEIFPQEAIKGGARIVGTGRSDFTNQINNAVVFPGLFRGVLDARAREINYEMKIAAANAVASCVTESELNENYIIPKMFNPKLRDSVAKAVKKVAERTI